MQRSACGNASGWWEPEGIGWRGAMVAHMTFNHGVAGSIPAVSTKNIINDLAAPNPSEELMIPE